MLEIVAMTYKKLEPRIKHVTVRKFSREHVNRLLIICSRKLFHIIADKGYIFTPHLYV